MERQQISFGILLNKFVYCVLHPPFMAASYFQDHFLHFMRIWFLMGGKDGCRKVFYG